MKSHVALSSPRNQERLAKLLLLIQDKPATVAQLFKESGLAKSDVWTILNGVRDDKAHVSDWARGKSQYAPMWLAGPGPSVPRPVWVSLPRIYPKKPMPTFGYKPQPVRRGWDAVMLFGEAA